MSNAGSPQSVWRRFFTMLAQTGIAHTLLCVLRKLGARFMTFGSVTFFVQDLDFNLPQRRLGLEVAIDPRRPIGLEELRECDERISEAMLSDRHERGDVCYVATDARRKIVHSHWISTTAGYIPELDMDFVLGPGDAYMYNATTRADLRGRGLFAGVRDFFVKRLHDEGFRKLFFYVRDDNIIGLQAESRWLRSPGRFYYFQLRGFRPLVYGRRSPELPVLTRTGSSRPRELPQLRPVYARMLALSAFLVAAIGRETLEK